MKAVPDTHAAGGDHPLDVVLPNPLGQASRSVRKRFRGLTTRLGSCSVSCIARLRKRVLVRFTRTWRIDIHVSHLRSSLLVDCLMLGTSMQPWSGVAPSTGTRSRRSGIRRRVSTWSRLIAPRSLATRSSPPPVASNTAKSPAGGTISTNSTRRGNGGASRKRTAMRKRTDADPRDAKSSASPLDRSNRGISSSTICVRISKQG